MTIGMTPIELRKVVGKRIRFLRKAKGWSQEELGEHATLSYKFIGEIERGLVNPSLDTLHSISDALQVELPRIFSNDQMYLLDSEDVAKLQTALDALNKVVVQNSL